MRLKYDQEYWDNYYDGSYEDTFHYGFQLDGALNCWNNLYKESPKSFLDIGCGPGYTLQAAEKYIPKVSGIECQEIPKKDLVHPNVIIGNFLDISKTIEPVDLVYCACTMYIPWNEQAYFLAEAMRLAKKAIVFPNAYLFESGIPDDKLRTVLYTSRRDFKSGIESLGNWKKYGTMYEFFYRLST